MTSNPLGSFLITYAVALVTILVADGIWLGLLARNLYKREMGALMREKLQPLPGIVFYVMYPAAIVYLCLWNGTPTLPDALARGAVLGLAAYGAYNLTNLSVVTRWPTRLSLIDWAWGTFLTALASGVAFLVMR